MKGEEEELVTLDTRAEEEEEELVTLDPRAEEEEEDTTRLFPREDPEAADPIVGVGGPEAGAVEGRVDPWVEMGGVNMLKG